MAIEPTFLDHVPLWAFFMGTLVVALAMTECGYLLGRWRARGTTKPSEGESVAAVSGATLGLLSFLLAFTFGLAASRYDSRREAFQSEVNAISTTYLRAALLPEPRTVEIRKLLREYVQVRQDAQDSKISLSETVEKSRALQVDLWKQAADVGRDVNGNKEGAPNSDMVALFADALSDLTSAHANRVAAVVRARVPAAIWAGLFVIAITGLFSMGYNLGVREAARSVVGYGMILCFVVTMALIADLDRPMEGFIRVNAQAMIDLRNLMKEQGP